MLSDLTIVKRRSLVSRLKATLRACNREGSFNVWYYLSHEDQIW